jgi:hypothetical protein
MILLFKGKSGTSLKIDTSILKDSPEKPFLPVSGRKGARDD